MAAMDGQGMAKRPARFSRRVSAHPTRLLVSTILLLLSTLAFAAEPASVVIMPLKQMEIPAGPAPSTVTIDLHGKRAALLAAARNEAVVLQFDEVEANRSPGVSYQVFVGLAKDAKADASSPFFAGNLTLYSAGIRSEARGEFHPANFRYHIEKQLREALRGNARSLLIRFVPQGDALVPVRIRSAAIVRNQ
jgi:hypothetical protein